MKENDQAAQQPLIGNEKIRCKAVHQNRKDQGIDGDHYDYKYTCLLRENRYM